jgi:hypothetical protein
VSLVSFGWQGLWDKAKGNPRPLKFVARLLHMSLIQAAWLLDDLWVPEWRQAAFQGPLFILGHQRSGTTVMHRALSESPQACGATLAQMLLPALSLWRLGRAGLKLDGACGGYLSRWLRAKEEAAFSVLDDIHKVRMGEVEEDEFFLWTLFASGMCANDSAASMQNGDLDILRHPESWSSARRESVWDWYQSCLRKVAYFASAGKGTSPWLIAKNPAFSNRIPELLARFPDARFLILHRDPRRAIASRLGLVERIWAAKKACTAFGSEHVELIYQDSLQTYRNIDRHVSSIPSVRRVELTTKSLERDPGAALKLIEDTLGPKAASFPPPHRAGKNVRLEDFGLTAARVENDLPSNFERRIWETV